MLDHWMRLAATAFFCVTLVGCGTSGRTEALTARRSIAFDARDIGKAPREFEVALTGGGEMPKWVVRRDEVGQPVLRQETLDDTSYRFPLCVYRGISTKDVTAEVQFRAEAGVVDQAGGIILRYRPENYYIARLNALEDNINFFKTVDGKRIKLVEVPMKVTPNEWHTLKVVAEGSRFRIWFDGKMAIETMDDSIQSAGRVGLWTKADAVGSFRSFSVGPTQ